MRKILVGNTNTYVRSLLINIKPQFLYNMLLRVSLLLFVFLLHTVYPAGGKGAPYRRTHLRMQYGVLLFSPYVINATQRFNKL